MSKSYSNIRFFFSVLFLNLTCFAALAGSNGPEESSATSVSTEKIMLLQCPWSSSENAACLSTFDFSRKIARAYLGFRSETGDYRLFQEPEEVVRNGFYTDGYDESGKWKFFGKFNYYNENSGKVKWFDMMEPLPDNPYSVGDSVGGNYSKDYFIMEGKSAFRANDRLSFGFDVKYKSGKGTKRKDPRPENTITDFEISPGFIWSFNKFRLGGFLKFETAKEDIEFTTVTDQKFDFFYFRGLGAFTFSMEEEGRYSGSTLFGSGLQFSFGSGPVHNMTSFSYGRRATDIKRGDTYPLQVVLLEDNLTNFESTFLFNPGHTTINRLNFHFSNKKSFGEEPVVEPKKEEVSYQWSTAAKYTLYWHTSNEYGFNYNYYKIIDQDHLNWGASLSGKIASDKTTYYFVPEFNRQEFNRLQLSAAFEKGFMIRKNQIIVAWNGGLRSSFNNRLDLVKDPVLLKGVNTAFATHDFNYNSSGFWETGLTLTCARNISVYKSPLQLFFEVGNKILKSGFNGSSGRNIFNFNLGITF